MGAEEPSCGNGDVMVVQPEAILNDGPKPVSVEDTIDEEDYLFRVSDPESAPEEIQSDALFLDNQLPAAVGEEEQNDKTNDAATATEQAEVKEIPVQQPDELNTFEAETSPSIQTAFRDAPLPVAGSSPNDPMNSVNLNRSATTSPLSSFGDLSAATQANATEKAPLNAAPRSPKPKLVPNSNRPAFYGQNWGGKPGPAAMFPGPGPHPPGQAAPQGFYPFHPMHISPHLHNAHLSPAAHASRLELHMPSGYDLVARKLAGQGPGTSLPPLYRRFKALNHRLLLGIQDELCYLEELLAKQDSDDCQSRSYLDGTVPSSRRKESIERNEITVQRQATLETIAFKLTQYNSLLTTFKSTMEFNDAIEEDIHDYQSYLAETKPIVSTETRFLSKEQDLLCLPRGRYDHHVDSEGRKTPVPRAVVMPQSPRPNPVRDEHAGYMMGSPRPPVIRQPGILLKHTILGVCMAIVLPILSFPVVPGFLSRMTVVLLVFLGLLVVFFQAGLYTQLVQQDSVMEGAIAVGVYCTFMAVVAGTFG